MQRIKKKMKIIIYLQKEKGVHDITAMFIVRVLYIKKIYFLISNYLSCFYD